MRTRKVGTVTLGCILILFGILFILRNIITGLSYQFILKLWPLIFISLGSEVLASYFRNREEKLTYDTGAIWIMILLSFFAIFMAGAEFLAAYTQMYPLSSIRI